MVNQYTIFLALAGLTALLSLSVAVYAFRHPHVPGAAYIGIYHTLVVGWLLFNSLEILAATENNTLMFAKITYLFFSPIPIFWFLFVLLYSGHTGWINPLRSALLFIPAVLMIVLVWTNDSHALIWSDIDFLKDGKLLALQVSHGSVFYLYMGLLYVLILAGLLLLLERYLRSKTVYRNQSLIMIFASCLPIFFHVTYVFQLIPGLTKDFSPISFAISGFGIAFVAFYSNLFDIIPISREQVVDYMQDAMLVVDHRDRIVDCNAAAKKVFMSCSGHLIPDSIDSILTDWPIWMQDAQVGQTSVFQYQQEDQHYEVKVTLFPDFRDDLVAKLVLIQDVTEREKFIKQLNTYAIIDPLVNIYNRRHFLELAEDLLPRMAAQNEQISLLMIDLDHFKRINDTYGHTVGDQVLQMFGNDCRQFIRGQDILARFGGEEFVLLLPKVGLMQAYQIAERLRSEVEERAIYIAEHVINITISIGVACITPDRGGQIMDLIDRADKAVYEAKQSGRNRVTLFYETDAI
jgi:diguanylate cyclase (GGDEF)-like protein